MRKICAVALVALMGIAAPAVTAESAPLQQSATQGASNQEYMAYQGSEGSGAQDPQQGTDEGGFCSSDSMACVGGGLLLAGGLTAAILLATNHHHHHYQVSP